MYFIRKEQWWSLFKNEWCLFQWLLFLLHDIVSFASHFLICLAMQAVLSEQAQDLLMPNAAHATQTCHSLTFLFKSGTQIFLIILRLLLKSAAEASLARSACNNSKLELCRISSEAIFMLLAKTLRLFFFSKLPGQKGFANVTWIKKSCFAGSDPRSNVSSSLCNEQLLDSALWWKEGGVPNA